jgi:hypothetical protein
MREICEVQDCEKEVYGFIKTRRNYHGKTCRDYYFTKNDRWCKCKTEYYYLHFNVCSTHFEYDPDPEKYGHIVYKTDYAYFFRNIAPKQ